MSSKGGAAKSSTKKRKTPAPSTEITKAVPETSGAAAHPPSILEPPYSCKLMWVKGVVRVTVNLQRVPDKCINFTPTSDHFYLDTFKHTKKYKLDFAYPQGVKVDASAPEATLEQGILKTDLRIVDWAEAAKQHAEIVSTHQSMLKSRGIKGTDEKEVKVEQKRKPSPNQPAKPVLSQEAKPVQSKPELKQSSKKKAAKSPKGKNAPTQAPPVESKDDTAVSKPKKKKRFLEKSEMSEILGQVVEAVETKTDQRLHRDEVEGSHLQEVLQSKKEKQENRKKRKLEARALLKKSIKRKKNKTKTEEVTGSKKKVMFSP